MIKHGHRKSRSRTYVSWQRMKDRCLNPKNENYHNYGGRGVQIDPNWRQDFRNFLKDMGHRPEGKTLDRINPDGNYEVSNCRWATAKRQARNKRVKADPSL